MPGPQEPTGRVSFAAAPVRNLWIPWNFPQIPSVASPRLVTLKGE